MKNKPAYTKKIPKKQITQWVGALGYEIIDEIITPNCPSITPGSVVADLYGASISLYTDNEKQDNKIVKQIIKRYKLDPLEAKIVVDPDVPIALIVLYILEAGTYV